MTSGLPSRTAQTEEFLGAFSIEGHGDLTALGNRGLGDTLPGSSAEGTAGFELIIRQGTRPTDLNLSLGLARDARTARFFGPESSGENSNRLITPSGTAPSGRARYSLEVVPWLWLLTQTSDCRIFQNQTVPDILRRVLVENGLTDFGPFLLNRVYPQREFVVQYRETDFNFISRLMEEEGIFYFFQHHQAGHKLILADSLETFPHAGSLDLQDPNRDGKRSLEAGVHDWSMTQELRGGKWTHRDYNFITPNTDLTASAFAQVPGALSLEIYDYPGGYADLGAGQTLASIRSEELVSGVQVARGQTSSLRLSTGSRWRLANHPQADQNRDFVVTSSRYEIDTQANVAS